MHQRQRIRWVSVRCQGIKLAWQRWRWHCCAKEIKFCEGTHTHTEVRSQPHTYAAPHAVSNHHDIDWFVVFFKKDREKQLERIEISSFFRCGKYLEAISVAATKTFSQLSFNSSQEHTDNLNYHHVFQWCCPWNCLVRALSLISGYCSIEGAGKEEKQSYLHD